MKNAKKSMFITTILMVAVLIVAVSTATFAWYTASTTASSSEVNLMSAKSESANIAVGWTTDAQTASITFANPAVDGEGNVTEFFQPAAPKFAFGTEQNDTYSEAALYTAGIDANKQFSADGALTNGWKVKSTDSNYATQDYFYVVNNNANAGVTVVMNCTITGTLADRLCVAVYVGGDFKGIFTTVEGGYSYGEIEGEALQTSLSKDATKTVTKVDIELAANTNSTDNYAQVSYIAWFDGAATQDAQAGKDASFQFSFGVANNA